MKYHQYSDFFDQN